MDEAEEPCRTDTSGIHELGTGAPLTRASKANGSLVTRTSHSRWSPSVDEATIACDATVVFESVQRAHDSQLAMP